MHLRTSRTSRQGRTYEYAQLVQSYRRADGMPAQKVVASLGALSPLEMNNLRLALEASRTGRAVVLPSGMVTRQTVANLRYLDVAVGLELWRAWGLGELARRVLPAHDTDVDEADVLGALVVQRLVAPASKLAATRWFARTALPELLGIAPGQFNNSRVHRVLDGLDAAADERLQDALAERHREGREKTGVSQVVFVDLTDTWFVGRGPKMAEPNGTKEGLYRRKIGIVLACDDEGYPLRWRVVRGRQSEPSAVLDMLGTTGGTDWLGDRPIVVDRALGTTEHLEALEQRGHKYLTALRRNEYDSYCPDIPYAAVEMVDWRAPHAADQARAAIGPHLQRVADDLFLRDVGWVERDARPQPAGADEDVEDITVKAMRQAQQMAADLRSRRVRNQREAGHRFALAKEHANKLLHLMSLAADLQQDVLAGGAKGVSLATLRGVAAEPNPTRQRQKYDGAVARALARPRQPTGRAPRVTADLAPPKARRRLVLAFNPEVFVQQRIVADDKLAEVQASFRQWVGKGTRGSKLAGAVDSLLQRRHLKEIFTLQQARDDEPPRLVFHEEAWRSRRRFDGFSVIVTNDDKPAKPEELVRWYRAKDKVEKDFQTIKSVVRIRPVRHKTDDKVRAHVTICVLALLIERTIERRLERAGHPASAPSVLEALSDVHLNLLDLGDDHSAYDLTCASANQAALLAALDLPDLANAEVLVTRLTPR